MARSEAPLVARRVGLRACAAIGAGCREAVESEGRGAAERDPTRPAIVRLGAEAAAALAAIPDTPQLATTDRAFVALYPLETGKLGDPVVRRMRALVARYREECQIDRLLLYLTIADAYARCLGHHPKDAGS